MEPLEGDQALLDGEGPLEHDGPYIALARDGAARLELGRGDPAVLIPHPAEQRHVCLPHHGHAPNLDRVLVLHWRRSIHADLLIGVTPSPTARRRFPIAYGPVQRAGT